MAHLIIKYCIKLVDGQKRKPEVKCIFDYIYPEERVKMMVKG